MAAKKRRTESEPVRREQLLSAARKVFKEKGYAGATIADIVREAGVAQGTFYLYYPSKLTIAIALRDSLMTRMATAAKKAVESADSFNAKLAGLISASFLLARQNSDLYRLAFIGADETHPEMHSESAEHSSFLELVKGLFCIGVESGEVEVADLDIAARLTTGLLQHAIIEAYAFGKGGEADRLQSGVSTMLLNAFLKKR